MKRKYGNINAPVEVQIDELRRKINWAIDKMNQDREELDKTLKAVKSFQLEEVNDRLSKLEHMH